MNPKAGSQSLQPYFCCDISITRKEESILQSRALGSLAESGQVVAVRRARFTGSKKRLEISRKEGWRSRTGWVEFSWQLVGTEEVKTIWRWSAAHGALKYCPLHEEQQIRCEGNHPTPRPFQKKKTISTQNKNKQECPDHDLKQWNQEYETGIKTIKCFYRYSSFGFLMAVVVNPV